MKTWKVVEWERRPDEVRGLPLICPSCGTEATMEVDAKAHGSIIAAIGLSVIFDPPGYRPPENFMPDVVKCRTCRREFSSK